MRKTTPTIQVALELLKDPNAIHWGYDLMQRLGIKSGVLYDILNRMRACGWLTAEWEDPTESTRTPRRMYQLTPTGGQALELMVDEARSDPRFTHLFDSYAKVATNEDH